VVVDGRIFRGTIHEIQSALALLELGPTASLWVLRRQRLDRGPDGGLVDAMVAPGHEGRMCRSVFGSVCPNAQKNGLREGSPFSKREVANFSQD